MIILRIFFITMFVISFALLWIITNNPDVVKWYQLYREKDDPEMMEIMKTQSWAPVIWAILALLTWL